MKKKRACLLPKPFYNRLFWKVLLNSWTIFVFIIVTLDFFNKTDYNNNAVGVASAIYIAILGIYAANKEFDRWTKRFSSRFIGEMYVWVWTALMILFLAISLTGRPDCHISTEVTATYISVLGIFAITQQSKKINKESKEK